MDTPQPSLELAWSFAPWVGVSVCVGALFAAADAAVTAIPEARLRAMVEHAESPRPALERALREPLALLSRLLVGRVVCIVSASVLGALALHRAYPRWGAWIAAASIALVYTMVAEVVTSVVRTRAAAVAPTLLALVRPLEIAVMPLAVPVAWLGQAVSRGFPVSARTSDPAEARIAEAEVENLIEQGKKTGAIPGEDAERLQAAVEFSGKVAEDVLVPRTRMVAFAMGTPLPKILERIVAEGHSRYPVYDQRIDDVVGLLFVKDLFRIVREGRLESTTLAAIVRKPVLAVQERQPVADVLREMRQRRQHLAIVLDHHGGTAGLVTLEDILELLVGDIRDELDDDEPVQASGEGNLLVDAAISVDEVSERLGVTLPEGQGFVSIGGLLMEHLGKVPESGATLRLGPVEFVVRDADERRVRRVEIRRLSDSDEVAS